MRHSIAKVNIRITAGGGMDGIAIQHELSRLFWHDLSVKIEHMFDQFSKEHETLVIDRLFIDLGNISEKDWANEFQIKLLEAIQKALQITTAAGRKKGDEGAHPRSHDHQMPVSTTDDISDKTIKISGQQSLPARQRLFEIWLYFLQTGRLPPAGVLPADEQEWHRAILEMLAAETAAEQKFLDLLLRYRDAATRLARQFDELFLMRIAAILNRQNLEQLPHLREQLSAYWKSLRSAAPQKTDVAKLFHSLHTAYSQSNFWAAFFLQMATYQLKNLSLEKAALLPFIRFRHSIETEQVRVLKSVLEENTHQKWPDDKKKKRYAPKIPTATLIEAILAALADNPSQQTGALPQKDTPLQPVVLPPNTAEENKTTPDEARENMYVQQAGIVLTHAFLPAFFKNLGLLDDKKQFTEPFAQQKAIHLIQFLATGEEKLPEYRLILPKLLCGLPLEYPLERNILLSASEKAEADDLLKSLLTHWNALGSTSPAGLREGFFDRTGKLSHTQKGPLLQVESRTLDIMLNRLPWSISLIKLPWMKEVLQVDWSH